MNEQQSESLLNEVLGTIQHSKEMTYDQVRVLHCLLGNTVVEALHLIDTDSVARLECGDQAKRHLYRIQDTVEAPKEKKETQLCFLLPRHCTCGVFLSSVICEQKALVCRHVLAALLFEALQRQQGIITLDEETFAEILYTWNPPTTHRT
ncbi:hypothetical protein [Absidia glauca]|uniref:SWIM-type domain-containing protein n=1 Tax=Absidia glauca TaxID=4829 RepID=A0A168LSU9_ABSGL|nr:hypothetical protein [Absidia glauca]